MQRGARRWLVLGTLALVAGAQGLGYLHLATAHHVFCAAHGELLEVTGTPAAPAPGGDAPALAATDAAPPGHEHCVVDGCLRQPTAPAEAAPAAAVPVPVGAATAAAPAAAPPPRAILRFAPKTSPPSATEVTA